MMSDTSATSHFSGNIPGNYDEYLGPMFFEPYGKEIGEWFDPSAVGTALEIACGTGRVTRHLRATLPSSSTLVASDISPDMLAVAREKLKDLNIDWRLVDAHDLPFTSNSVDLVVCYFGYMFVADKVKAYAEARRILKKGGLLLMATWDKLEANEASHIFRTAVKKYLGDTLPESYNLPFSMHDPAPIEEMLKEAGFSRTRSVRVTEKMQAETPAKAAQGLVRGGSLYNEIIKRNPAWVEEIESIVERELEDRYGKGPVNAAMRAVITQAWK
jgi:ubiquinone/menaquinone biosynthesis C-methylase UbiE